MPVCSLVGRLLYLFSELVSFAKERFVKLCRSELFRKEIHFVDIFQIEETEQGETNFTYTTWGKKLRLSMHLLCPLPPFCLSSFNQMDSCRGVIHISDDTQVFNLCRFDQISSCLGETLKLFISFEVAKIIFYFKSKSKPWMHHLISS